MRSRFLLMATGIAAMLGGDALARSVPAGCMDAVEKDARARNAASFADALLRLGESLAALGEKEAACATLNEVGRKFPRAAANVRQSAEREQKRSGC